MKKLSIFFLLLFFTENTMAQINPYGLDITPEGKVVLSLFEPNYNGNVDDPTEVKCDGEEVLINDWRNVRYDYLTIIECPDEKWTEPNNLSPSHINDTLIPREIDWSKMTHSLVFSDSVFMAVVKPDGSPADNRQFHDWGSGLELTDALLAELRRKLQNYVHQYSGVADTDEALGKLRKELSAVDTVIEKRAVYDYLVDQLQFYNYNENDQLTSVIGYHWDLGVEFDSLRYDSRGNMVYFSRETIGGGQEEYSIEYDESDRVIKVTRMQSSAEEKNSFDHNADDFETSNYTYDESGIVNSKSVLLPDGNWYTCTFHQK